MMVMQLLVEDMQLPLEDMQLPTMDILHKAVDMELPQLLLTGMELPQITMEPLHTTNPLDML